jgi:hypothetical protein
MQIHIRIVLLALTVFMFSCERQSAAPNIDPVLGVECFEHHRASLPPGTQYEGIEKLADNLLTIRIMNGVEVVTLDCELAVDGTALATGE